MILQSGSKTVFFRQACVRTRGISWPRRARHQPEFHRSSRHPLHGLAGEAVDVSMQGSQIIERVDVRKLTCVDQAHEQIADTSATLGFIEETIISMQNPFFQSALDDAAVEWSAGNAQKQS